MKKDTKKPRQKTNKELVASIPKEDLIRIKANLVNAVAINPLLEDHVRVENFKLVFESYNHKLCQLADCDETLIKKTIERFKEITRVSPRNITTTSFYSAPIKRGDKSYENLYATLPPDADLYHINIGSAARMFYYKASNCFCIVTVLKVHR